MVILPLILDEDITRKLPDRFLSQLAMCSTDTIKLKVREYIDNPGAEKEAKEKIIKAYADVLGLEDYLFSEETLQRVELIKDMDYYTINTYLTETQLLAYKEAILSILENESSIPYIAPIRGTKVKELLEDLKQYAVSTELPEAKKLYESIKCCARFFRDSPFEGNKGTPVKKIIRNKGKYQIILRGIDFMLEKKRVGALPASWRYL